MRLAALGREGEGLFLPSDKWEREELLTCWCSRGLRVRPWTRSGRRQRNEHRRAAPRRRQTGLPDKEAIDRRAVRNHSFAQSSVSNTPTHAYARVRVTLRDKCSQLNIAELLQTQTLEPHVAKY